MKTLKSILTITSIALFSFAAQTASAQKIYYNSSTGKVAIDNNTVSYTCSVEDFKSASAATDLAAKLKTTKGIYSADVLNYNAGSATMVVKMFTMDSGLTLQNALATAGIASIFIDNVSVPSNGIVDYMKAKNGK